MKSERSIAKSRISKSTHIVNDPKMDDLLMIKAYTNDIFKLNINFNDKLVQKVLLNNNWTQEMFRIKEYQKFIMEKRIWKS